MNDSEAGLVATELAGNSLRHVRPPVGVRLQVCWYPDKKANYVLASFPVPAE